MNEKNKPTQTELDYHADVLELSRELAMREGFQGQIETYPFMGNTSLSLEDRLRLAIMVGSVDTVKRALELGADVTTRTDNDIDLLHFAEIHGRDDLLPLLKTYINVDIPKKPKKSSK